MKNMLVLFDTNIILDILEKRLPFYNSSKSVLETCVSGNVTDYIITRNTDDFKNSNVPAVTPADFLREYCP